MVKEDNEMTLIMKGVIKRVSLVYFGPPKLDWIGLVRY